VSAAGSRRAPASKRTKLAKVKMPEYKEGAPRGETALESPEWRTFVGRWLEMSRCKVESAPRGDWEVELSEHLQKRWRRQRVRMVFDPARPTVPRGAWFMAPAAPPAGGCSRPR